MKPSETLTIHDATHNRTVEIELDQFDGVYRVCIKHDPQDRALWYHFDFDEEYKLNLFLESKGLERI